MSIETLERPAELQTQEIALQFPDVAQQTLFEKVDASLGRFYLDHPELKAGLDPVLDEYKQARAGFGAQALNYARETATGVGSPVAQTEPPESIANTFAKQPNQSYAPTVETDDYTPRHSTPKQAAANELAVSPYLEKFEDNQHANQHKSAPANELIAQHEEPIAAIGHEDFDSKFALVLHNFGNALNKKKPEASVVRNAFSAFENAFRDAGDGELSDVSKQRIEQAVRHYQDDYEAHQQAVTEEVAAERYNDEVEASPEARKSRFAKYLGKNVMPKLMKKLDVYVAQRNYRPKHSGYRGRHAK